MRKEKPVTMQLNVGLPLAGMTVFRMNRHGDKRRPYIYCRIWPAYPDQASLLVSTLLMHRYG
jgi:hypothetical protein